MISSKILAQNTERLNCDTKLSYHGWMARMTFSFFSLNQYRNSMFELTPAIMENQNKFACT